MLKRNKIESSTKVLINHRDKKHVKSDSLSSSTSHVNRYAQRLRCVSSRVSSAAATAAKKCKSHTTAEQPGNIAETTQKHVAVHFGNFYGLRDNIKETHRDNRWSNTLGAKEITATEWKRRSEFTRQMVHKLERASDTEDYARQVSTLLKETVEPPNFRLNPFLSENSIPSGGRRISDYPLWYKEPHEIPLVFSNPIAQLDA
ncbi:uncharacterized protein LOC116850626 [Odontomachus brunneus]|uniref:uncharacterized protein LOC116850626 n=1 Tax=Odontomachus brunneus TaxID=486640 RepID=UPI0013F220A8|nr:uncharacterized protein LOC116850626 [Odontomachus brunneus]